MAAGAVLLGAAFFIFFEVVRVHAATSGHFEGEASASIHGEHVRDARLEAIKLAKRVALQAALDATWPTSVQDAKRTGIRGKLIPNVDRFILTYQTLFDARTDNDWRVRVSVTFDMTKLESAFNALDSPYSREGIAVLVIVFDEAESGFARIPGFDTRISGALSVLDVGVADSKAADAVAKSEEIQSAIGGDLRPLMKIRETFGVRVVAFGVRRPLRLVPGEDAEKRRDDPDARTVFFRVHDLDARKNLAEFKYTWKTGSGDQIPEDAVDEIAARIHESMENAGLFQAHEIRRLNVEIRGLHDFDAVKKLTGSWGKIRGVRSAAFDSFRSGGIARLVVDYSGTDEEFTDAVLKIEDASVKLRPAPGRPGFPTFEVVH